MGAALAGLGLALGKAVNSAREFESAMIEVQKVTDPETARNMADAIQQMATEIPIAQEELAGLTADAARFGIRGEQNLERFVTSVSKMAVATNLSASDAGEALARLGKLTHTGADQIENLGSVINELSNNFATSSQEIVDSMLRSGAALSQFGLRQTEIAGLSAAINEVSESSRRGGTRLRRLAQELLNPDKVKDVASALGMNAEEFRRLRMNDPVEVFRQLARVMKDGGAEADILRKNLSTASRQAVAGLAQNMKGLRGSLEQARNEFQENNSLQEEFDAASTTLNNRLTLLRNRIENVAIAAGEKLIPFIKDVVDGFSDWIGNADEAEEKVNAFFEALEDNEILQKTADTLGILTTETGRFVDSLGNVIGTHSKANDEMEEGTKVLSETEEQWIKFKTTMATGLDALFQGLVTLFDAMLTFSKMSRDLMVPGAEIAKTMFVGAADAALSFGQIVKQVLERDIEGAFETFQSLGDRTMDRMQDIRDAGGEMAEGIGKFDDRLGGLLERTTERGEGVFDRAQERRRTQFSSVNQGPWEDVGTTGGGGGGGGERRPGTAQPRGGASGGGGGQQETMVKVEIGAADSDLMDAILNAPTTNINQRVQSSQRREFDRLQGRGDFA